MNSRIQQRRQDEYFMRMVLSLAVRGTGLVSPNPKVGCVVVQEGKAVGWGWHRRFGSAHAEVEALKMAGPLAEGATLYVNLEPCCHMGKTPPCTDQLIKAGIRRAVVGMTDPNPLVSGRGIQQLAEAGIEVATGLLEQDCRWINRGFIRSMTLGRPWVTLKAAISLDGDIALVDGESKWISSPIARQKAHLLRAENDAVLVGIGTVLADDPELTVRYTNGSSPMRIVLDSQARVPLDAKIMNAAAPSLIVTDSQAKPSRLEALKKKNIRVAQVSSINGTFELKTVLSCIREYGINRLLVEGGARIISSFLKEELVDEIALFLAPKLLGRGLRLTDTFEIHHMEDAFKLKNITLRQLGDDVWFEGVPSCSPAL